MTRRCIGIAGIGLFVASSVIGLMFPIVTGARQAQASTSRGQSVGGKFMCMCGCNQVLTQCNHVGCTYSHAMLKEVDDRVARGDSDDLILQSFIQEYGLTVLVDPPKKGFTSLVWIAPIVAPFLALFLVWILVKRWRGRVVDSGAPEDFGGGIGTGAEAGCARD